MVSSSKTFAGVSIFGEEDLEKLKQSVDLVTTKSVKREHASVRELRHIGPKSSGAPEKALISCYIGPDGVLVEQKIHPSQVIVSLDEFLKEVELEVLLELEGNIELARYKDCVLGIKDIPLRNIRIFDDAEYKAREYFLDIEWKDIVGVRVSENPELGKIMAKAIELSDKMWPHMSRPPCCLDEDYVRIVCDGHVYDFLKHASGPDYIVKKGVFTVELMWSTGTNSFGPEGQYMYLVPSLVAQKII